MFGNYLKNFPVDEVRDTYMNDDLSAFPYVNDGLFADDSIIIPFACRLNNPVFAMQVNDHILVINQYTEVIKCNI